MRIGDMIIEMNVDTSGMQRALEDFRMAIRQNERLSMCTNQEIEDTYLNAGNLTRSAIRFDAESEANKVALQEAAERYQKSHKRATEAWNNLHDFLEGQRSNAMESSKFFPTVTEREDEDKPRAVSIGRPE